MLADVKVGDKVTIHDHDGRLLRIGKCGRVLATSVLIHGKRFMLKSGKEVGSKCFARPVDAEKLVAAETELVKREAEKNAAEEATLHAAYESLPEPVKLARALRWLCDCENEKTVAEAPLEHLRGIVEWAKERNLTTE